jgi:hypothetical protein
MVSLSTFNGRNQCLVPVSSLIRQVFPPFDEPAMANVSGSDRSSILATRTNDLDFQLAARASLSTGRTTAKSIDFLMQEFTIITVHHKTGRFTLCSLR